MSRGAGRPDMSDPIEAAIVQIQRTARRWALLRWYVAVAVGAVALITCGVLADHLFILQKSGRAVFFALFVVACTLGLLAATVFPLLGRLNRLYVARQIERIRPELRNSLISYLQSKDDERVPLEVRRLLRHNTFEKVRSVDPRLMAETQAVARFGWTLLGLLAALAIYGVMSPKSVPVSVCRLLAPGKAILPPTRTRIVGVEPGDVYLLRGQTLSVRVQLKGAQAEHAFIVWSGRSFADKRILLTDKGNGKWQGELAAVIEDGTYWVAAGDSRSDAYSITTLPQPAVTRIVATLVPPAYSGRPVQTVEEGNLDVLSETKVVLTAHTNLPPGSGYMEMGSGSRVWMEVNSGQSTLTGSLTITRPDSYRIMFETTVYPDGSKFETASPMTYQITCRGDQAPRVQVLAPPDGIHMSPDARVRVEYIAEDDFGLVRLALKYGVNGAHTGTAELPVERVVRSVKDGYDWQLGALALRNGDELTYSVEATDNWPRGPNVAASPPRKIIIGQPEERVAQAEKKPTDQAKQNEEKKADEQPKQDEKPKQESGQKPREDEGAKKPGSEGKKDTGEKPKPEGAADKKPGSGQQEQERQLASRIADAFKRGGKEAPGGEDGGKQGEKPPAASPEKRTGSGAEGRPCPNCGKAMEGGQCKSCSGGAGGSGGSGSGEKKVAQAGSGQKAGSGDAGQPCPDCGKPMAGGKCANCSGGGVKPGGTGAGGGQGGAQPGAGGTGAGEKGAQGEGGQPPGQGTEGAQAGGRSPTGSPGGGLGSAGTGADETAATPLVREEPLKDFDTRGVLQEVQRTLQKGDLPEEMLKDLGMNRKQLEEFLRGYLEKPEEGEQAGGEPVEVEGKQAKGDVLAARGAKASDVAVGDAGPAEVKKDEMRSRFEDASNRISPRYRDAVAAYYKKLTRQE